MSSAFAAAAAATSAASEADDGRPQKRPANDARDESSAAKRQKNSIVTPPRPAPLYLFATTTDVQARRGASRDHWSRTQCLTLREMLGKKH